MAEEKLVLSEAAQETILQCLKRGNSVELKLIKGEISIIEIERKLKMKTSANG